MSAANQSIAARVRNGLVVTGGSDAIRQAVEFATGIVLARLLMPEDFGVVAVVGSILQLSFVVANFGMGTAVVQAAEIDTADRHTAFTLSSLVGLILMLAVWAAAPWATSFFAMPSLAVFIPLMSTQLLVSGMSAIPVALLRRELAFKKLVVIEMGSSVVYAIVGVTLALSGFGIWSLVWTPIVSALWGLVASFILARYRPAPALAKSSLDKFFAFGSGLTVKNLFVYLSRNVDNLITAKMLGDRAAGLYTRGFNLTRMPQTRVVAVVYRVFFPAFCKLQHDRERLHYWYLSATEIIAVLATPLLLGLAVVSEDFTVAVLGQQWEAMAPVLRILCIAALVNCIHMLGGAVIEAVGMIRYEVYTQAVYAAAVFCGCLFGARYGTEGIAYGVLGASIVFYAMKAYTLNAAVGLPVRSYVRAAIPSLAAGIIMYVAVYVVLNGAGSISPLVPLTNHWARLLVGTAVGAVTYPAALAVVGRTHLKLLLEQAGAMTGFGRRTLESEPRTIQA